MPPLKMVGSKKINEEMNMFSDYFFKYYHLPCKRTANGFILLTFLHIKRFYYYKIQKNRNLNLFFLNCFSCLQI